MKTPEPLSAPVDRCGDGGRRDAAVATRFIFNPFSGHNRRHPGRARAIADFIEQHRLDADIAKTEGPGHATELARAAVEAGCARIVAVGGDGTLNEVARALVGTSAVLGMVPCGSGNGLARHLGVPLQLGRALDLLLPGQGVEVLIDSGVADGHPFFNVMGLGFDAEIARAFNALERRGLAAYARTGLSQFARHRPERFEISHDAGNTVIDAFVVTIANSSQYGNNALIAPAARVDDGVLDLIAVPPPGLFSTAPLLARLFLGTLRDGSGVRCLPGKNFRIRRAAPGVMHVDGETRHVGATVEITVRPASLRVLAGRQL